MDVSRRDLLKLLAVAAGAGLAPRSLEAADGPARLLAFEPLGNVTLLHITDAHATLRPVFYREPDTVVGVGAERGRPPFLTGAELLRAYHLSPGTVEAYAYTYLDFATLAARYGRMGGYAHLATLVKRGLGDRALEPRRGHGAGLEPARCRGLHAALGVRVRARPRQGALRRSRAAGDARRRLRRAQRGRGQLGRAPVSPLHDPRRGRRARGGHRPGVSVHARLASPAVRARSHLRHPGRRRPGPGQRAAGRQEG